MPSIQVTLNILSDDLLLFVFLFLLWRSRLCEECHGWVVVVQVVYVGDYLSVSRVNCTLI